MKLNDLKEMTILFDRILPCEEGTGNSWPIFFKD